MTSRLVRAAMTAALLPPLLVSLPARAQQVEHVFVFILDGIRADHAFDDPDHHFVGPLYHELAPSGSLLTYMEVRAQTVTMPAHQALVSGNYADYSGTTPYPERRWMGPRTPTLCESYRAATGAGQQSCWIVSNSDYLHDLTYGLMPGYGPDLGGDRQIFYENDPTDSWSWEKVDEVLAENEVDLMVVNLNETDVWGHAYEWELYTGAASLASDRIVAFWERLQDDPTYAGSSAVIVTSDHGRHLEGVETGWQGHGCACAGCRHVFMLAIGPGIKQGYVSELSCSILDVAPTAAHLLGFDMPYSRGRVLAEILEDGDEVDRGPGGSFRPLQVRGGDLVVRMSEVQDTAVADDEGAHRVLTEISYDGGESWDEEWTEAGEVVQHSPFAWTDGEVVLAGWLEVESKGDSWFVRLRRLGPEAPGWVEVVYLEMLAASTPVSNITLTETDGLLYLVENNPRNRRVRIWNSDDRGLSWSDDYVMQAHARHFPRDLRAVEVDGAWVVTYSANPNNIMDDEDPNENTEIYWLRTEDAGVTWEGEASLTNEVAPSIQPQTVVTPDGVLHVLWSDRRSGAFELYHSGSTDNGVTFSPPAQLTFGGVGAWEPSLVVDGERAYVAWSQFEARDSARVHLAALDGDTLVDERVFGDLAMARTPHLLPMGDCTSVVTWSEGNLVDGWQLADERVATSGHPVTAATAVVESGPMRAGGNKAQVSIGIDLEVGEDDRGVTRLELTAPDAVELQGNGIVEVDGDQVAAEETVEGSSLVLALAEVVHADGAHVVLRFDVTPPDEVGDAGRYELTLHHGLEPCYAIVEGDLMATAEPVEGDDDTTGGPADDDDDDDDCQCRADGSPAPATLTLLTLLGAVAALRRRI